MTYFPKISYFIRLDLDMAYYYCNRILLLCYVRFQVLILLIIYVNETVGIEPAYVPSTFEI